jgi:hypothetical protein
LISNKALGKLLVELKTLGWEHSKKSFEFFFENLGVVSTPLKCFQKWFWTNGVGQGGKRSGGFKKRHWLLCIHPGQLTLATTLPRYGTGLSPKFVCLSAGSLALYKGF